MVPVPNMGRQMFFISQSETSYGSPQSSDSPANVRKPSANSRALSTCLSPSAVMRPHGVL